MLDLSLARLVLEGKDNKKTRVFSKKTRVKTRVFSEKTRVFLLSFPSTDLARERSNMTFSSLAISVDIADAGNHTMPILGCVVGRAVICASLSGVATTCLMTIF